MVEALSQLHRFLTLRGLETEVTELTPDASTRSYFRIAYKGSAAIACVYPEPFEHSTQPFLDATRLFHDSGLPVAKILDHEGGLGVILQEDFGDTILREVLERSDSTARERYIDEAIGLIARIQSGTARARESGAIAGSLAFDFEKLSWELDFFTEHYFTTLKGRPLTSPIADRFKLELDSVSRELAGRATVLTHRDFHAANLMLGPDGALKIIDHQDARMGSASYDLVSLLLDRVTELPSPQWLSTKRRRLLDERVALGLPEIDEAEFAHEFRLQTVQRCLKAIGTFSFQSANRGKTHFLPFIRPMFGIVRRACENLGGFPVLSEVISNELDAAD